MTEVADDEKAVAVSRPGRAEKIKNALELETVGNSETQELKTKLQDKLKTAGKDKLEEALKVLGD